EDLHDEGQVSWVLGQCATGLVACLNAQSTLLPDERLEAEGRGYLLTTLFDLWKFGCDYGGVEVDIAAAIAGNATTDERKEVEAWLRQQMRPGQDSSSKWHNSSIVNFLVTLKQAGHCSDEDVLEEYRNASLYKELTEKYLQFGRTHEALDVAQANVTEPRDVTWFAEELLKSGEAWQEQALAFVEMRLKEVEYALQSNPKDFTSARSVDAYRHWLGEKYSIYGKTEQTLNIALARFQAGSDDTTYRSVRSAAQVAGQPEDVWSGLRPQLLRTLEQQNRWAALISIYLEEKEVGQALSALAEMEHAPGTSPYGYGYRSGSGLSQYQAQVAQAAEEPYPDDAIRLYKSLAQKLIDARERESYRQAVSYLTRVRLLYQKQERELEWQAYIANLRNSNKDRRALKEELDKKGI
ncbi:MAG TPA: hypothetical protein VHV10_07765, partial [Ktedonobacteraceae bacterium]|nr:hypothetical protein [Ktedonobacteraceae bacterium]